VVVVSPSRLGRGEVEEADNGSFADAGRGDILEDAHGRASNGERVGVEGNGEERPVLQEGEVSTRDVAGEVRARHNGLGLAVGECAGLDDGAAGTVRGGRNRIDHPAAARQHLRPGVAKFVFLERGDRRRLTARSRQAHHTAPNPADHDRAVIGPPPAGGSWRLAERHHGSAVR